MAAPKHYLLSTPFRYRPVHASRFRKAGSLGLWYGAAAYFSASWTAFQTDRGRDFSGIVDGVSV